jgi:hypothetical protein
MRRIKIKREFSVAIFSFFLKTFAKIGRFLFFFGIYFATFGLRIWKLSDFGGFQSPEAKKTTTIIVAIYNIYIKKSFKINLKNIYIYILCVRSQNVKRWLKICSWYLIYSQICLNLLRVDKWPLNFTSSYEQLPFWLPKKKPKKNKLWLFLKLELDKCFLISFLWCNTSGDHPKKDLAHKWVGTRCWVLN